MINLANKTANIKHKNLPVYITV